MTWKILEGDCLTVMQGMEAESVHSIITDPPYGLSFMGKDWDRGVPGCHFWQEAIRVAKPGAFLLVFGGTRTFHRLAVAIEDAGWEIRDTVMWVYGSGFPKSLNIGKAVDKLQWNERKVVGYRRLTGNAGTPIKLKGGTFSVGVCVNMTGVKIPITKGTSAWEGWGTALKPAWEPIIVARKPIDGTVAENVLKWGVGGINVDGCRIATEEDNRRPSRGGNNGLNGTSTFKIRERKIEDRVKQSGRWPANLIHDGSEEVVELFPNSVSSDRTRHNNQSKTSGKENGANCYGKYNDIDTCGYSDSGSAARFFYCAKASKEDRGEGCDDLPVGEPPSSGRSKPAAGRQNALGKPRGNHHPTVKPTALMRYLCKLVTPPDGLILDPFCCSGSTGKAALLEGFNFIGIELQAEYCQIAEARLQRIANDQPLFNMEVL